MLILDGNLFKFAFVVDLIYFFKRILFNKCEPYKEDQATKNRKYELATIFYEKWSQQSC